MLKDEIAVIGAGLAGETVGIEFQRRNYLTYLINGSVQDNKSLPDAKNLLVLEGYDGLSGERSLAYEALKRNRRILKKIAEIDKKIIICIASGGGSTGSGTLPYISEIAASNPDKIVVAVLLMPRPDEAIQKRLNAYKNKLEFPDLLFTTKFCTPLNSQIYCDAIEKIINEINLTRDPLDTMDKFSGHCFRHTFATRCFEAGIQPKTVQAYLGHATLQMTMDLYTSVMDKKKTDDMQLLEDTVQLDNVDEYAHENKIIKFA